jgi:hypothetical protein
LERPLHESLTSADNNKKYLKTVFGSNDYDIMTVSERLVHCTAVNLYCRNHGRARAAGPFVGRVSIEVRAVAVEETNRTHGHMHKTTVMVTRRQASLRVTRKKPEREREILSCCPGPGGLAHRNTRRDESQETPSRRERGRAGSLQQTRTRRLQPEEGQKAGPR